MSIPQPNYTQIPNIFLEEWMYRLKRESTIIFLAICRKIIGYHKEYDKISYSQLHKMTGIRMGTIKTALDELEDVGLIILTRSQGKTNKIELNMEPLLQVESTPPTGGEVTPPTGGDTKESINKLDKKNVLYIPLAKLLYDEHKKLDEKYLSGNGRLDETFERWGKDIRLLVEKDGRDKGEVEAVIRWTQEPGNFWNANILSGAKLRKQYPRLILQMQKNGADRFTKKRESEYLERNRANLKKIIEG